MDNQPTNGFHPGLMLGVGAAFSVLTVMATITDVSKLVPSSSPAIACAELVKSGAGLSQRQFAEFLTIPERYQKQQVRSIVQEPHCRLPGLEVRSGVQAEREAYSLTFNPQIQLVILYEGDEYAGYTIGPR